VTGDTSGRRSRSKRPPGKLQPSFWTLHCSAMRSESAGSGSTARYVRLRRL